MHTIVVNQGASIKNLETRIRQLTKLITNFSKDYARNTVGNPTKEECKALRERTETAEEKQKRDEKELRQLQKWFKQLGLTLEEAYDEFMEELDKYYEETLAERLNIVSQLPIKRKDPGTFVIPCYLGKVQEKALCELGFNINLMPLKFARKWEIEELNIHYEKEIVLADQSIIRPSGIMKDVIVKVNNMLFPVDFTVVDIEEDADVPIILGRPFLATSRAVIDMEKEVLKLRMRDEEQLIYIRGENDWCCWIESREPKNPG
ncbi:uncharacterized protein LOC123896497 [Trifolium pratense]|uniref:uncharacterized protein LOC123896497 n=1 Tax=Trifolium pratense TaxID=57577 RepID=UPI001E69161A|nr:uncharacterized protein LOC123896497 [Trifolium pratense]